MSVAGCTGSDNRSARRPYELTRPGPSEVVAVREDDGPKILPETHFASARLFESRRMIHKAIKQYEKAIALNHGYVEAYQRLGLLLSYTGQRKRALVAMRRAVQLRPDDAILRNNLGFELLMAKRLPEASEQLTQAVALDGDFARARVNLGIAKSLQGRFDDALEDFLVVLPEADAYYNLGLMYRSGNRPEQAAQAFRRVLTIRPGFSAAERQLQSVLASMDPPTPVTHIDHTIDRPEGETPATAPVEFVGPVLPVHAAVDARAATTETRTVASRSSNDASSWNELYAAVNRLAATDPEAADHTTRVQRPIDQIDHRVKSTVVANDPVITDAVETWTAGVEGTEPLDINKLVAIIDGEAPCEDEVDIGPTGSIRIRERRSPTPPVEKTVAHATAPIAPPVVAAKVYSVTEAKKALEPDHPIKKAVRVDKSKESVEIVKEDKIDRIIDVGVARKPKAAVIIEPSAVDRADCLADVDLSEILSSPADVVVADAGDAGVPLESIMSVWVEPESVGHVSIDLASIASIIDPYEVDIIQAMIEEEDPCEDYRLIDYRQDFARRAPTPGAMFVAPSEFLSSSRRVDTAEDAVIARAVIESFPEDLWLNYVDSVSSSADPVVTYSVVVPASFVVPAPIAPRPQEPIASTDAMAVLRELEYALAEVRNEVRCLDALNEPDVPSTDVVAGIDRDETSAGDADVGPVWFAVCRQDIEVGPPIALAPVIAKSDSSKIINAKKLEGVVRLVSETGPSPISAPSQRSMRTTGRKATPTKRRSRKNVIVTPPSNRSRNVREKRRDDSRAEGTGFMEILRNELDCLQAEEDAGSERSIHAALGAIDARQPFGWPVFDIDDALSSRLGDPRFDALLTTPEPTDRLGWDWTVVRNDGTVHPSTRPTPTASEGKTNAESLDWLFSAYGNPRKP